MPLPLGRRFVIEPDRLNHDQFLDLGMHPNELAVVGAHTAFVLLRVEIWTSRLHEWLSIRTVCSRQQISYPGKATFFLAKM